VAGLCDAVSLFKMTSSSAISYKRQGHNDEREDFRVSVF